jgi:hypothetical protein
MTTADENVNFQINGTDLLMRDLNIFCSTTANHRAILEQLKSMALNNNTTGASIYDLGRVVQSDSIAELNSVLKSAEQKSTELKQQEMQQQQQMQQEQMQAQAEQQKLKLDHEAMEAEKNRQRDVLVAEIRAAGMGSMVDINQNLQSDYTDAMKDIRQQQQYQDQTTLERQKEVNRNMLASQKNDLEREKMQTQKEIADKQLQVARENKNKYDNTNNNKKEK